MREFVRKNHRWLQGERQYPPSVNDDDDQGSSGIDNRETNKTNEGVWRNRRFHCDLYLNVRLRLELGNVKLDNFRIRMPAGK